MPPVPEGCNTGNAAVPPIESKGEGEVPAGRQHHILVADDEEDMGDTLKRALMRAGYQVTLARDGLEALRVLHNHACDLLIADIRMPRMGGMELLQETRKVNPALPVILITGFGDHASYLEGMRLGAVHFLCKPLRIAELVTAVRHTLRQE